MNPTSLCCWFPIVSTLDIPVPRTEIVPLPEPMSGELAMVTCLFHPMEMAAAVPVLGIEAQLTRHDVMSDECETALSRLMPEIEAAGAAIGYPLFARTDMVSGKHGYLGTCYVPDAASLPDHVHALAGEHEGALWLEPDTPLEAIVLRELLPVETPIVAFNGLPITRERRYFVEDGKVVCHHAYWSDEKNIEKGVAPWRGGHAPENWRAVLADLNRQDYEVPLLTMYAERVSKALPGAWSVDFMQAADSTWYLIDMAVADRSWHPEH